MLVQNLGSDLGRLHRVGKYILNTTTGILYADFPHIDAFRCYLKIEHVGAEFSMDPALCLALETDALARLERQRQENIKRRKEREEAQAELDREHAQQVQAERIMKEHNVPQFLADLPLEVVLVVEREIEKAESVFCVDS